MAKGDPGKREFTYFMLGASRFLYASSARLILLKVRSVSCLLAFHFVTAVGWLMSCCSIPGLCRVSRVPGTIAGF